MADKLHKDFDTADGIHIIHTWTATDDADRAFLTLTADDIGKVCYQLDSGAFWLLVDWIPGEGGATWFELTQTPDLSTKADRYRTYRAHTGTTDTAVLADGGNVVTSNNAAAVLQTIPSNAAVPYPIDTIIEFIQLGAGQMTFAVTTDTLLPIPGGVAKSAGQGASVFLKKVATTTWQILGNLAAS